MIVVPWDPRLCLRPEGPITTFQASGPTTTSSGTSNQFFSPDVPKLVPPNIQTASARIAATTAAMMANLLLLGPAVRQLSRDAWVVCVSNDAAWNNAPRWSRAPSRRRNAVAAHAARAGAIAVDKDAPARGRSAGEPLLRKPSRSR